MTKVFGVRKILTFIFPFLVIIILGLAGTGAYKASEGVRGSPFVNQPGSISVLDEGGYLEWPLRVFNGQIPYRDFWTPYGPLRIYLVSIFMKIFGESIYTTRLYFALFPLIGFVSFYLLAKILTRSSLISFLATFLAIAGSIVGERNSLFLAASFLFAKSVFENVPVKKKFAVNHKFLFLAGVLSALQFSLSQEFGVYAMGGISVFLTFYLLFRRITFPCYLQLLFTYFLGIIILLGPFFILVFTSGALPGFIHYAFTDYLSPSFTKVWTDPFPSFFFQPPVTWFGENGYLNLPVIQSYILIIFFLFLLVFSLFKLIRNRERNEYWSLLLISLFALFTIRGLFYSRTLERRQGVLVFFYLAIVSLDVLVLKIREVVDFQKYRVVPVVFFLVLLNWYMISSLPLPGYLNNLVELITLSYNPKGILIDHPRVGIRVYPTSIDQIRQGFFDIKPGVLESRIRINSLPVSQKTREEFNNDYVPNVLGLETLLLNLQPTSSQILNRDRGLIDQLDNLRQKVLELDRKNAFFDAEISQLKNNLSQQKKFALQKNKIDDTSWVDLQQQQKYLADVKASLNQNHDFFTAVLDKLSIDNFVWELDKTAYFLPIAKYLAENKNIYGYGVPYPSIFLFIANKISGARFSPTYSFLTLSEQKEIIGDLEKTKPCKIIRTASFEMTGSAVTDYLSLVWTYLDKNYHKVKEISGIEMLERISCKKSPSQKD